jgi:hypothetical protein
MKDPKRQEFLAAIDQLRDWKKAGRLAAACGAISFISRLLWQLLFGHPIDFQSAIELGCITGSFSFLLARFVLPRIGKFL